MLNNFTETWGSHRRSACRMEHLSVWSSGTCSPKWSIKKEHGIYSLDQLPSKHCFDFFHVRSSVCFACFPTLNTNLKSWDAKPSQLHLTVSAPVNNLPFTKPREGRSVVFFPWQSAQLNKTMHTGLKNCKVFRYTITTICFRHFFQQRKMSCPSLPTNSNNTHLLPWNTSIQTWKTSNISA